MGADDAVRGASSHAVFRAAARGDAQAQREIFSAHKLAVARLVYRMTHDPSVVDDIVQEVFIAAFGALPSYRGDAPLRTWLCSIAVNRVRNHWDATRRRQVREAKASPSQSPDDGLAAPLAALEALEHRTRLVRALEGLPTILREAFVLRYVEGMSLHEVSAVLGVPVSTVSHRARRAEDLLCEALGLAGRGGA